MSTIRIADKPTLDTVLNTVESRGGVKYDSSSSKPSFYDTVNNTWIPVDIGGGVLEDLL